MSRLIFWGRVHPERTYVSLSGFDAVIHGDDEYPIRARVRIDILVAQITVTVEGELLGLPTEMIKNSVEELVHERLDAFGFATGRGYEAELVAAVDESGSVEVFGIEMSGLSESQRDCVTLEQVTQALRYEQPYLRLALADLRRAIREPVDTGLYCFRAIETVKQHFADNADPPSDSGEAWRRLREALRVERGFINDQVKVFADVRRHGAVRSVGNNERAAQLRAARAIVARFVLYLNDGCTKLPPERYPVLA